MELFLKRAGDVVWSIDPPWWRSPVVEPAYNARDRAPSRERVREAASRHPNNYLRG